MNEIKQQQLTWNKGMTNIPSDLVCDDNTCESEVNMIYRDGEHRPIQDEQLMFEGNKLLPVVFVHKYNNYKHYISLKPDNTITWYDEEGLLAPKDIENAPVNGDSVQVEAIGNTLIVNSSNGLGYYLWKPETGNYKYLGNKIPKPEIYFTLFTSEVSSKQLVKTELDGAGIIKGVTNDSGHGVSRIVLEEDKEDDYKNLIVGLYSKNKNEISKAKGFCNPFFVRAAIKMYDGSLTAYTVPILAFPCVGENSYLAFVGQGSYFVTHYATLSFKQHTDYSDWRDLVKKIQIGIAKPVDLYDTENYILYNTSKGIYGIIENKMKQYTPFGSSGTEGNYFYPFKNADVKSGLKEASVFNMLCEIPVEASDRWKDISEYFRSTDLENLTSKPTMGDDYYSNCKISATNIYINNHRLNISNIKRWYGPIPETCILYDNTDTTMLLQMYVYIRTNDGDKIVYREMFTKERIWQHYFFYPDPRAYKVEFATEITVGDKKELRGTTINLEEHNFLNGAFFLGDLPSIDDTPLELTNNISELVANMSPEYLQNQIWTSEVNNPWVFTAKGNNTIGSGEILGLASQTTALSQGQFGQYPLIAFCTDGIWALQTDNEGLYSAVHPMSREICNNPKSITETDGYVFFTTEKGLMVVDGGQVRCVSEQMSGKMADSSNAVVYNGALAESAPLWLKDYLKNCYIAYDYRDSLLWIFIPNRTIAFVYSMKDGTFGMKIIPNIQRAINDYPDTLLQDKDGKVYSLLNRDDINTDSNSYDCELISRPMKLENSTALKTLSRVKLIYELTHSTKAEVKVFASNDCKNWVRVLSLHGRGFKYWKFAIRFREMSAVDTFSGALINTQERYTYRMR